MDIAILTSRTIDWLRNAQGRLYGNSGRASEDHIVNIISVHYCRKEARELDLTSYSILLCISYLSIPLAPFSWASREENHIALTFISIIWVLIAPSPLVTIPSLMMKGLYPGSFLDFKSLSLNYFLVFIVLVSLIIYFHLSKKYICYSLSIIALSLANTGVGTLPFIPGVINSKDAIEIFGQGVVIFLYVLAFIAIAASLADSALGLKIFREEKKFLTRLRVLKAIQKKGGLRYQELKKDLGVQESNLSEALNTLLNKREIDVKTENGEDYFVLGKESQAEDM